MKRFDSPVVVHLIPKDGLGGTESAARSMEPNVHVGVEIWFMAGPTLSNSSIIRSLSPSSQLGHPIVYWNAFIRLWRARPRVLVCSLWRSTIVGLLIKLVRPSTKLILMTHSTRYSHALDWAITTCAMVRADAIWCDSESTRKALVSQRNYQKSRVISFLVKPNRHPSDVQGLDFVYWGRLVKKKGLPRAISIFARVQEKFPEIRFYIFGPAGDDEEEIRRRAQLLPQGAVRIMGEKPPEEFPEPIPSAAFFLMPSTHEGMAVAVVEAMHLGLIPVVTPVGEIAAYCIDGQNSVIIKSDDQAVTDIISLIQDPSRMQSASQSAVERWADVVSYSTDFRRGYMPYLESMESGE